ncbi:MAG TPA: 3'-5' exonuclease [Cyclobacteriaceae bacterium]|nr:3'-5' exonuclease [Cyclobacteriaceae bacterium]
MINNTELDEREYLEEIKDKLNSSLKRVDERVRLHNTELRQNKEYMYEHQSGHDEADLVAADLSEMRMVFTGANTVAIKKKIHKLLASPYFGRIDFAVGPTAPNPIYIGIHSFTDEVTRKGLIFDWRAPVSSMFYDYELGPAEYKTPSGTVKGQISLKRQYRIKDGRMEFMIENSLNIHDEVLQKELSKSSDDRMKNIVATIQRDQNKVIRNESAPVMIIQGVAGSGKTSIALHRVAFLLYRFRDSIRSKDILIISPNKVFADYISNVLPELGEEHIPEIGMDELATELLENKFRFQTFFQQVYTLLERPDDRFVERMRFKSSFEFLSKLNQYLIHVENNYFQPEEIRVAGTVIPFPFIQERFKAYHRMPIMKRFPEMIADILQYLRGQVNRKLTGREKTKVWEAVPKMFRIASVIDLYRDFYDWLGRKDLFVHFNGDGLEYADVFPLIYCKIRLEGTTTHEKVKHLLVDEMQDYTPIHYAVLSRVFLCKKTVLGDINQTVNPYSASSADTIEEVFPQGEIVKLVRSYRSTFEIAKFALEVKPNPDMIPMERHGEEPEVKGFAKLEDEVEGIRKMIADFQESGYQSMGIICKTQRQASMLHSQLRSPDVHLLTADSTSYTQGIALTTVHMAKGLEFDDVVLPMVGEKNYATEVDRSLLYIACTRAMHRLTLTHTGEKSKFIVRKT